MKDEIIRYLMDKYNPDSIITYGSYADGSENANSDFDALIIADSSKKHDGSIICGVTLDVFIYSPAVFANAYEPSDFIQIHDGKIELDRHGAAQKLKEEVLWYIENLPMKSPDEIFQELEWCNKMVLRTIREDAEGYFRWHWLLTDSLEIYYDIVRKRYFGPKKALKQMEQCDDKSFRKYENALKHFSKETLSEWIDCLNQLSSDLAE